MNELDENSYKSGEMYEYKGKITKVPISIDTYDSSYLLTYFKCTDSF